MGKITQRKKNRQKLENLKNDDDEEKSNISSLELSLQSSKTIEENNPSNIINMNDDLKNMSPEIEKRKENNNLDDNDDDSIDLSNKNEDEDEKNEENKNDKENKNEEKINEENKNEEKINEENKNEEKNNDVREKEKEIEKEKEETEKEKEKNKEEIETKKTNELSKKNNIIDQELKEIISKKTKKCLSDIEKYLEDISILDKNPSIQKIINKLNFYDKKHNKYSVPINEEDICSVISYYLTSDQ